MSTSQRAVALVQARMSSSRLPGKVLLDLAGRPTIMHLCDRLNAVDGLDDLVVVTTSHPTDDPLVSYLESQGIASFRYDGPIDDLLGRYIGAGEAHNADIVLMVCGDCPLFDPDTAARMIARLREHPDAEYVSIEPQTLEGGVACLRLSTYQRIDREGAEGPYREHATLRIMKHPDEFNIVSIAPDPAFADVSRAHRFWLDTEADYQFLSTLYERLHVPGELVDFRDVLTLLDNEPKLKKINGHVQQKDPHFAGATVVLAVPENGENSAFLDSLAQQLVNVYSMGLKRVSNHELKDSGISVLGDVVVTLCAPPQSLGLPVVIVDAKEQPETVARRIRAAVSQKVAA